MNAQQYTVTAAISLLAVGASCVGHAQSGLTSIGVVAERLRVDVGVPCPVEPPPGMKVVSRSSGPSKSCDFVYEFRQVKNGKGTTYLFLYRGVKPPVGVGTGVRLEPNKLCQIRYKGKLHAVHPSYSDDTQSYMLKIAKQLPMMEDAVKPSDEEFNALFYSVPEQERLRLFTTLRLHVVSDNP